MFSLSNTAEGFGSASGKSTLVEKLVPALCAAVLGCGLIFVAGFAQSADLHNAAHDGRHSAAFPCH